MARIYGITGTPGTGKKTVARSVAKALRVPSLDLNEFARIEDLIGNGSSIDTSDLRERISKEVKGSALVFGHLLPLVLPRRMTERVVVLRCEPTMLRKRLEKRGYPPKKVTENVEAELIGLISQESMVAFGNKAIDFDNSKVDPETSSKKIVQLLRSNRTRIQPIDWTLLYDTAPRLKRLLPTGPHS